MPRTIIDTQEAPHLGLPYHQGVRWGDLVFVAGQIGVDPKTGELAGDDITTQTERVFDNIRAILMAAGSSLDMCLEAVCFLSDLDDFEAFNRVYSRYFPSGGPPRTTVQASLPLSGLKVEIRVIAGIEAG